MCQVIASYIDGVLDIHGTEFSALNKVDLTWSQDDGQHTNKVLEIGGSSRFEGRYVVPKPCRGQCITVVVTLDDDTEHVFQGYGDELNGQRTVLEREESGDQLGRIGCDRNGCSPDTK